MALKTFTGMAGDGKWETPGNWAGNALPMQILVPYQSYAPVVTSPGVPTVSVTGVGGGSGTLPTGIYWVYVQAVNGTGNWSAPIAAASTVSLTLGQTLTVSATEAQAGDTLSFYLLQTTVSANNPEYTFRLLAATGVNTPAQGIAPGASVILTGYAPLDDVVITLDTVLGSSEPPSYPPVYGNIFASLTLSDTAGWTDPLLLLTYPLINLRGISVARPASVSYGWIVFSGTFLSGGTAPASLPAGKIVPKFILGNFTESGLNPVYKFDFGCAVLINPIISMANARKLPVHFTTGNILGLSHIFYNWAYDAYSIAQTTDFLDANANQPTNAGPNTVSQTSLSGVNMVVDTSLAIVDVAGPTGYSIVYNTASKITANGPSVFVYQFVYPQNTLTALPLVAGTGTFNSSSINSASVVNGVVAALAPLTSAVSTSNASVAGIPAQVLAGLVVKSGDGQYHPIQTDINGMVSAIAYPAPGFSPNELLLGDPQAMFSNDGLGHGVVHNIGGAD